MILRMMPAMGKKGIKGHKIMKIRQTILPTMMMMQPTRRRKRRVKNPMIRETRRSMNI